MYEWERNEITKEQIAIECHRLREEIKRISNTTLRGNFVDEDDRQYWVKRVKQLNSKLLALESR